MTSTPNDDQLSALTALNATASFNTWAGITVVAASPGQVTLRLRWRAELGQYFGHLHAGVIAALIDTACGFAAYTLAGPVATSHCAVSYLAPGAGPTVTATATTAKVGRRQIFANAELRGERDGRLVLIAQGQTLLIPVGGGPSATR